MKVDSQRRRESENRKLKRNEMRVVGLPAVVGQALPVMNQMWVFFRSPPLPAPILNQTEALPAVVGLSSFEGAPSFSGGRGSERGEGKVWCREKGKRPVRPDGWRTWLSGVRSVGGRPAAGSWSGSHFTESDDSDSVNHKWKWAFAAFCSFRFGWVFFF